MGSLISSSRDSHLNIMDAIRKKMKSLKDETDGLYAIIKKFEDETKESNSILEQAECDIRDYGKKVHGFEIDFDETLDKLNKANESYDKKDKVVESKCMNNEVTLEELDKNLRQTTKMASDNEQKLDELSRKLGVQEEELKRAVERAEL